MITLIDYGVGNISAIESVYRGLNIETKIAKTEADLEFAEKLILPGVGSFDHALKRLNQSGMREKLEQLVLIDKKPILGICVGMQMMATKSEEGNSEGLNWVKGEVLKFEQSAIEHDAKIPHMGWNDVIIKESNKLFLNLEKNSLFYFLHSYYFKCNDQKDDIASAEYGSVFTVAVNSNNIYGIQFHPEKSHHYGEVLLENFAKL